MTAREKWLKKHLHDTDTKHYIENICHEFPDLQISSLYTSIYTRWIYNMETATSDVL